MRPIISSDGKWTFATYKISRTAGTSSRTSVNREFEGPNRSEAVVFLGTRNGDAERLPPGFPPVQTENSPRFFYMQNNPFRDHVYAGIPPEMIAQRPRRATWPGPPELERPTLSRDLPDTIGLAVRSLKGEVLRIYLPADFAKAVAAIRK